MAQDARTSNWRKPFPTGSLSQIPWVFPVFSLCFSFKVPRFSLTGKLGTHFQGFPWFLEWLETLHKSHPYNIMTLTKARSSIRIRRSSKAHTPGSEAVQTRTGVLNLGSVLVWEGMDVQDVQWVPANAISDLLVAYYCSQQNKCHQQVKLIVMPGTHKTGHKTAGHVATVSMSQVSRHGITTAATPSGNCLCQGRLVVILWTT